MKDYKEDYLLYLQFLESVYMLLETDSGFLLFSEEAKDKIYSIINFVLAKLIKPDIKIDKVRQLDEKMILKLKQKYGIEGIILDVDNTLIDYYKNLTEEVVNWAKEMKGQGIKLYILSNTNDKRKVKEVAEVLGIQYKHFAMKPFKRGFKYIEKQTNKNETDEKLENKLPPFFCYIRNKSFLCIKI